MFDQRTITNHTSKVSNKRKQASINVIQCMKMNATKTRLKTLTRNPNGFTDILTIITRRSRPIRWTRNKMQCESTVMSRQHILALNHASHFLTGDFRSVLWQQLTLPSDH